MKILLVHNYYNRPGGEDTVFHAEVALFRLHGHEVVEYLEFNNKIESMNKASVAIQTVWSFDSYHKIRALLNESKPAIVHFHNTFPLISPSAYYACRELNIPIVQTLHNQRLICPAATFYREGKLCLDCLGRTPPWPGVLHACYHDSHLHTAVVASMLTLHRWLGTWRKEIDVFLCSTNFYRDLFVQAGLPADKIVVIPHFVTEVTQPNSTKAFGDYALFVGRLDPEKGVKTLLEAWRHLDFPLKIRGSGRLDQEAREFVANNGLRDIEFVDRLDERELSNLIANARFLVVPSEGYYETFGLVIIEAYARGVPVIASNIGVVPELVSDKQTGLLFEAGNSLDLAEKAKWLWNQPEEAVSMGRRAYLEYKKKYTPERIYQILNDVYLRTIAAKER